MRQLPPKVRLGWAPVYLSNGLIEFNFIGIVEECDADFVRWIGSLRTIRVEVVVAGRTPCFGRGGDECWNAFEHLVELERP